MNKNPFLVHSKLNLSGNINYIKLLKIYVLIDVDDMLKYILNLSNLEISKKFSEIYKINYSQ